MPYLQRQDHKKCDELWQQARAAIEKDGHKQFFVVGFCWGVWKAWELGSKDDGFVSIVGFHPSIIAEKLFGRDEVELAKKQKCPSLLLPASNDQPNIKPDGELVNIIKEKFGDKAQSFEFPDMVHGWITRGDINDEKVKRDNQAALEKAKAYLDSFAL